MCRMLGGGGVIFGPLAVTILVLNNLQQHMSVPVGQIGGASMGFTHAFPLLWMKVE